MEYTDRAHPEDILPQDMQFNEVIQLLREDIVDPLIDQAEDTGDVIDPSSELLYDSQAVMQLSIHLAVMLHSEGEDLREVQISFYRGMTFALQIINDIKSQPITRLPLGDVILDEQNDAQTAESIKFQTQRYMSSRQNIDNLLYTFMPDLDKTDIYNHHVETGALLMFLLSERQLGEDYIDEHMAQLSPQDFM